MAKLRVRHPGKVNYEALGQPHLRWRTLQGPGGVRLYVYAHESGGRWLGYTRAGLKEAPCSHCGRTGVFGGHVKSHWCADCKHDCKAEPSMSWHGCGIWSSEKGWSEV